jgi:hypothetical protein
MCLASTFFWWFSAQKWVDIRKEDGKCTTASAAFLSQYAHARTQRERERERERGNHTHFLAIMCRAPTDEQPGESPARVPHRRCLEGSLRGSLPPYCAPCANTLHRLTQAVAFAEGLRVRLLDAGPPQPLCRDIWTGLVCQRKGYAHSCGFTNACAAARLIRRCLGNSLGCPLRARKWA